jgi:hypothetical protein
MTITKTSQTISPPQTNQSLISGDNIPNKVVGAALAALTGVALYSVIRLTTYCFRTAKYTPPDLTPFKQEPIKYAEDLLKMNPNLKRVRYQRPPYDPVDPRIGLFAAVFNLELGKLNNQLRFYKTQGLDPWEQQEILNLADSCMKVGYALGCIMLADFPNFAEKMRVQCRFKPEDLTPEQLVSRQDFYIYRVMYEPLRMYSGIRDQRIEDIFPFYPPSRKAIVQNPFQRAFYEDTSIQSSWRELYPT